MSDKPDDICPRPDRLRAQATQPFAAPIYLASVWSCESPQQADQLLGGQLSGYVYQREGHPNADWLADKVSLLHAAQQTVITSAGMSALAAALLAFLQHGDHVVLSNRLYGRTQRLFCEDGRRLGIEHSLVDVCDPQSVAAGFGPRTRMLIVETISNPTLRVADLPALAELARQHQALLLVDNTFATPIVCQPLRHGADLVMESASKMMNGHSDVMLGLLCGSRPDWQRVTDVVSTWGLTSSPLDCWLTARGLGTLPLRMQRACDNALQLAQLLTECPPVESVSYPGLSQHPDHALACQLFAEARFGTIVTATLAGGRAAAERFIRELSDSIAFCPSLGELATTLSHPQSTSHRSLSADQMRALGISPGTIRFSLGCESPDAILATVRRACQTL